MNQLSMPNRTNIFSFLVERPLLLAAGALCVAWLTFLGLANAVPLWMKYPFCILSLALVPGYGVFRIITYFQESHYDRLSIMLVSTSLSFSYNFFLNIVVFAFKLSISEAVLCSLAVSSALILTNIALNYHYLGSIKSEPFRFRPALIFFALGAVIIAIVTYSTPISGGYYAEELIVLRKLLLNHTIELRNLSIIQEEATTYLFVPFYLLIAMLSKICSVDIVAGLQIMWPFTSILSLLCITKITEFITGSRRPATIILTAYLLACVFPSQLRSDQLTFLLPTPDRYAFSAAVLIYLALFHFLIHVTDKKLNIAMFIGLVYIIVEVAFVHAREAIMVLGCIVLFLVIVFLHDGIRSELLVKTLVVVGVCVSALMGYKYINLFISPALGDYVNDTQGRLTSLLAQTLADGTFWKRFFYEIPGSNMDRYEYNLGFVNLAPVTTFIYMTLLAAPIYVLSVKEKLRYWFPLLVFSVLLILVSGPIKLLLGAIVGSEHLFRLTALIYIPCLVIFSDMVFILVDELNHSDLTRRTKVLFGTIGVFTLYILSSNIHSWFFTSSRLGDALFAVITIFIVLIKSTPCAWNSIQKFADSYDVRKVFSQSWQYILVICVCIVVLIPNYTKWKTTIRRSIYNIDFQLYYDDGVYANLSKMAQKDLLANSFIKDYYLPKEVYDFIAEKLPGQATWLGKSTALILIGSNQYSPILTYKGDFIGEYIYNDTFRTEYNMIKYSTIDLIKHPDPFIDIIKKFRINYILIEPDERSFVLEQIRIIDSLSNLLKVIFDQNGFAILEVINDQPSLR